MKHLAKLLLVFFTACTAEYSGKCGWDMEPICLSIMESWQCPYPAGQNLNNCPEHCRACAPSYMMKHKRTCENGRLDYFSNRCICYEGYEGDFCETPVCIHPCQNGGYCSVPRGHQCNCNMGYYGEFCQFYECKLPCKNGGHCSAVNQCTCREGYRGVSCETPECKPPCQNGGYCSTPNGNKCICPKRYVGASCEIELKLKPGMFCHTNEDCIEGLSCKRKLAHVRQNISNHSCQCPDGCVYLESFESCDCGNYYDSAEYFEQSVVWPSIVGSLLGFIIIGFWWCCIYNTIESHMKRDGSENGDDDGYYREDQSVNPMPFEENVIVNVIEVDPFGAAQDIVPPQPQMFVPPYLYGETPPSYSETFVNVAVTHQGPQPYSAQPFGPQSAPMYTTGLYGAPPPSYSETLTHVDVAYQAHQPYSHQQFGPYNQQPSAPMYGANMYGEHPPAYSETLAHDANQVHLSKK